MSQDNISLEDILNIIDLVNEIEDSCFLLEIIFEINQDVSSKYVEHLHYLVHLFLTLNTLQFKRIHKKLTALRDALN